MNVKTDSQDFEYFSVKLNDFRSMPILSLEKNENINHKIATSNNS